MSRNLRSAQTGVNRTRTHVSRRVKPRNRATPRTEVEGVLLILRLSPYVASSSVNWASAWDFFRLFGVGGGLVHRSRAPWPSLGADQRRASSRFPCRHYRHRRRRLGHLRPARQRSPERAARSSSLARSQVPNRRVALAPPPHTSLPWILIGFTLFVIVSI